MARIIAIISTIPTPLHRVPLDLELKPLGGTTMNSERGFGIDLNLRLGPLLGIGNGSAKKGDSTSYNGVMEVLS